MISVRRAQLDDLDAVLALFHASEVSPAAEDAARRQQIWQETITSSQMAVFVAGDQSILASCTLITAPNLLRQGRSHAFLENVVTHPDHRGRGYGSAAVRAALAHAWQMDCHQVLLQSGRADPRVHQFYRKCGFVPDLRTAYAIRRPD